MSYRLKNISIKNFKHISYDNSEAYEFYGKDIIILEGPNGYGKSTIFDGIELLITGKLEHFKQNLLPRGQESYKVLANRSDKDIIIEGAFYSADDEFTIRRIFKCSNNFNNELFIFKNNEWVVLEQQALYSMLRISNEIFNIGIYISQNESLNFLQNKYNNRKQQLAGILQETSINEKRDRIIEFRDKLKNKVKDKLTYLENIKNATKSKVDDLENKISQYNLLESKYEYFKLFKEKDYDFDKEVIDSNIQYDVIINPVKELLDFVSNYNSFMNTLNNKKIKGIINLDKGLLISYYYREVIIQLNENLSKIKMLKNIELYLDKLKNENYVINKEVLQYINLPTDTIEYLENLFNKLNANKGLLNNSQTILKDIIDKRKSLIKTFDTAVESSIIQNNACPLCGNESENIRDLFLKTEKLLKSNTDISLQNIKDIETDIQNKFHKEIIPILINILNENQLILYNYDVLKDYIKINTSDITKVMSEQRIEFTHNYESNLDLRDFEQKHQTLIEKIKEKEVPVDSYISDERIHVFLQIYNNYYNKNKPSHTIEDIQNKINYISYQYVNTYYEELRKHKNNHKKAADNYEKYKSSTDALIDDVEKLAEKYNSAYKKYQTSLANGIKVPLYIYSGKIIQNYPLGLGIEACINDSQITFKANGKDNDIFNILSTGQLNGVILSILLAIKSVYSNKLGLDMLLIDDPLQSIDDISACSFSDLLCEQFNNTQIIISTHEDDKSNLFKYKFNQMNLSAKAYNMQELYLA